MCIRDRVSDNSNNELINNSDKIVGEAVLTSDDNDINCNSEVSRNDNYDNISETMMLKNNGVNIESIDEVLECNYGMLVCVNGLRRVSEESYVGVMKQGVNFPHIYGEPRCSQMLLLKGKNPLLLEDMRSLNCSPNFYKSVPSAWNERESEIWCYGEGDIDREWCIASEIEVYELKRNYNKLRERIVGMNYFGNNNNKDLSDVIIKEYKNEKTNYLTLTDNTDGDWTILTDGDKIYYNGIMDKIKLIGYYDSNNYNNLYVDKNDESYKFIRYIYDDGG